MVVVGHALVLGAIGLGLLLAGTMGIGAAITIALFGLAGIASRRVVVGGLGQSSFPPPLLRSLEIGSSAIILLLGILFLLGSLR
jgi:ABC-type nickel/cobalt efflux system permease component RcnA